MQKTETTNDIIAQASIRINASLEKVWNALIDPSVIKEYMFGSTVRSSWKEGEAITWSGEWKGKAYEDKGVILKVEPRQLLQYSHYSPLEGLKDTASNYHIVTIGLTGDDGNVLVQLTQDKNADEVAREHSEKNWKMMLEGLKKYVEKK